MESKIDFFQRVPLKCLTLFCFVLTPLASAVWLNLAKTSRGTCTDSACDSMLYIWGDGSKFVHQTGIAINSGSDNNWAFAVHVSVTVPENTQITDLSPFSNLPAFCSIDCHPRKKTKLCSSLLLAS